MKFTRLTSLEEVEDLVKFHNTNSPFVVLDTETTSKDPRQAVLIDVQLSGRSTDEAVIFKAEFAPPIMQLKEELVIVGHSYKYDAHVLFRHAIDLLNHTWRDTLLIGHLLDENRDSYSLDSYVKEIWDDNYKESFWLKHKTYEEASEEDKLVYACKDIYFTGRLYKLHEKNLGIQEIPETLVTHVHRLQSCLLRTEIEGLAVDVEYLTDLGVKLKSQIDELGPKMRESAKEEIEIVELEMWQTAIGKYKSDKGKASAVKPEFSFESPKQLLRLLYGTLALPVQRNEKTKAISTDEASLEKIKGQHPLVELILKNRELQKVYGTYVQGTLEKLSYEHNESSPRVYPRFRVNGTVTGRISHNSPNLAQLPKQGGVRGIYVPDRGWVLISADYNQLEVILEANLTGDKNLLRMLENNESKHDLTARELRCSRDTAKTLNFAMQYCCSHFKVAKLLSVSLSEALGIWKRYWEIYAGPKELKAKTDKMVDDGVPLVSLYGRKRRFEIRKRSDWDGDYRQAYNFMIQSPGADLTSESFYLFDAWARKMEYGKGLFTVHDENIVTVRSDFVEPAEKALNTIMVDCGRRLGLKIPLKVATSGGMHRWLD